MTIIAAIAFVAMLVGVLFGIGLSALLKNDSGNAVAKTDSSPKITVTEEDQENPEDNINEEADATADDEALADETDDDSANTDTTETAETKDNTTAADKTDEDKTDADKADSDKNTANNKASTENVTTTLSTKIPFNSLNGKVMADESGKYLKYEIITNDCAWKDAFKDCVSRGGHLLYINDMAEYNKISKFILDEKCDGYTFYLGGMREEKSDKYFWVDSKKEPINDQALNKTKNWCSSLWAADQPNFHDNHGNDECYLTTYYSQSENRWLWSDNINDLPGINPNMEGLIAYICEYE